MPILNRIASVLFETLITEPAASLTSVLAGTDSVELGQAIVELAQTGEQKANYNARLTDALSAIERYLAKKRKSQIKDVADPQKNTRAFRKIPKNRTRTAWVWYKIWYLISMGNY